MTKPPPEGGEGFDNSLSYNFLVFKKEHP